MLGLVEIGIDKDGSLTQEEIAEYLYILIRDEPWVLFISLFSSAVLATVFMSFVVIGISRAGRFNPPKVVITIVLGIVALMALLTYALQPDNDSLGQVVAASVGGLAGALGTAFAETKVVKGETKFVEEEEAEKNGKSDESQSNSGSNSVGDSVGGLDSRYSDMARHVHTNSDSSTNGGDSNDSDISSGIPSERSSSESTERPS